MEEIVKHINDTNASYRSPNAGDAKNTDLFLDSDHYELFKDSGEQVTVRFSKDNLSKAILFIASILPRKYDNSSDHRTVVYSALFVYEQLALLDAFFTENGSPVEFKTQVWTPRKNVVKKNGEIDSRFYFNGLLESFKFLTPEGKTVSAKFSIRNYLAGGYSDLHIRKSEDGIFDVFVTNAQVPTNEQVTAQERHSQLKESVLSLQQITYGAPGTGKSFGIDEDVNKYHMTAIRTTFHPDTDYSTFVGAYKPQMENVPINSIYGESVQYATGKNGHPGTEKKIVYKYSQQAFLKAYVAAWKDLSNPYVLVIEEINRGNCAQIFGDLFQLLDRNDEGFSNYPISPDTDIMQVLSYEFEGLEIPDAEAINALYTEDVMSGVMNGNLLLLPRNLYIWATMNTSDQSLFPIDSAFKRRWEWKYVPISDAHKGWRILVNGVRYDWWSFLDAINKKIWDATRSEDKKLGYFFCKANHEGIITSDKFVGKVLFYIYNDVFKDYGFDDAIFKDEADKENPELLFKDFFLPDGKPREEKIQVFLKNLGVKTEDEVVSVSTQTSEEYGEDNENEPVATPKVEEPEPMPEDIDMHDDDPTRYSFDGNDGLGKSELALSAINKYLAEHSEDTFDQLRTALAAINMGAKFNLLGVLATENELKDVAYNIQKKAYGLFKKERKHKSADGVEYFVNGYWTMANIQSILNFAKSQGWTISTEI